MEGAPGGGEEAAGGEVGGEAVAALVLCEGTQLGPPVVPRVARHAQQQRVVEGVLGGDQAVAAENRVVALQQGDERHALVVRIVRR